MARYKNGIPVANNLFEAAAWHKAIKVTCRCGHSVTFDPHGLWWLFEQKGWDMRFRGARQYFACKPCRLDRGAKVRPFKIEAVRGMAEITLPMPPEREWKRAQSRFR